MKKKRGGCRREAEYICEGENPVSALEGLSEF